MWPFKKKEPYTIPSWTYHVVLTKTGEKVMFDERFYSVEDIDGDLYVKRIENGDLEGYFPGYTGEYRETVKFYGW